MNLDEQVDELLTVDRDAFRITRRTEEVVTAKCRDHVGCFDVSWYVGNDGKGHWICTCRPVPSSDPPCVHIAVISRVTCHPHESADA